MVRANASNSEITAVDVETSSDSAAFSPAEAVDGVWSKIVKALADADGALAKTGVVKTAKVASISQGGE